jgi:hypothetical protein
MKPYPVALFAALLVASSGMDSSGLGPSEAGAEGICRTVNFDMTPSEDLQIVIWIEDTAGNFIDTAFITRTTGSYGLGNRPGIMEFNSGPNWCYGKRTTTFPVWAHRHGLTWPMMIFQDEDERDLSHSISQSSLEQTYCRPIREDESLWDAQSCATTVYTDKGKFTCTPEEIAMGCVPEQSLYPPRNDATFNSDRDDLQVQTMLASNPFDAVSKPTPLGGVPYKALWAIPEDLPDGDYVAWIEVSKEFDTNADYAYLPPVGLSWSDYGIPYRGQPSVVHNVPFSIGGEDLAAISLDYLGYGDPDGIDGDIREPDATITSGVAGSGSGRLLVEAAADPMYRVRVQASSSNDEVAPGGAGQLEALETQPDSVSLQFIAPGDDDQEGTVNSYEVRFLAGGTLSDANWEQGTLASTQIAPLEAGTIQDFAIDGLLPNTNYSVGIRATDECLNEGPVVSLSVLTPRPEPGEVDACFVATAAYGSLMANEVTALRGFRDRFLRTHVTGELLVESYYTFGPAFAKLIKSSPLLRRSARAALAPAVEGAKKLIAR